MKITPMDPDREYEDAKHMANRLLWIMMNTSGDEMGNSPNGYIYVNRTALREVCEALTKP